MKGQMVRNETVTGTQRGDKPKEKVGLPTYFQFRHVNNNRQRHPLMKSN